MEVSKKVAVTRGQSVMESMKRKIVTIAHVQAEPTESVWDASLLRDPHHVVDKRSRVQKMFAAIAPSYDLNNRLHSLWMDQYWRRKAVMLAELKRADRVVDVACGTG